MKNILYICRKSPHRFKEIDFEILSEKYNVDWFYFKFTPFCILNLFLKLRHYDLAYCWFGNLWSFFTVVFSKIWKCKTVIVAGGHDVAKVSEIKYGLPQTRILKYFARYAIKNANCILSISNSNSNEIKEFTGRESVMIYTSVDFPVSVPVLKKKKQVLTVGMVDKLSSIRKGHFLFVETAKYFDDIKFILVGKQKDNTINKLRSIAGNNVEFCDFVDRKRLLELFSESVIYLQPSYHEAFGISVAEAMWCGCTPVVTKRGSLTEVVGNTGVIVEQMDSKILANAINEILNKPIEFNNKAKKQAENFALDIRKNKLLITINNLLNNNINYEN